MTTAPPANSTRAIRRRASKPSHVSCSLCADACVNALDRTLAVVVGPRLLDGHGQRVAGTDELVVVRQRGSCHAGLTCRGRRLRPHGGGLALRGGWLPGFRASLQQQANGCPQGPA